MSAKEISRNILKNLNKKLLSNDKYRLAKNACVQLNPISLAVDQEARHLLQPFYNTKITNETKPVTDQKSSGRCWIFACLNVIRLSLQKKFSSDELELSQSFVFYYDKIERSIYALKTQLDLAIKDEEVNGRLVSFLIEKPLEDGGQWSMLQNIIEKYGLMPKAAFPDNVNSQASFRMNRLLNTKVKQFTCEMRKLLKEGKKKEDIEKKIFGCYLDEIHRIVTICLGIPPETFTWEYKTNDGKYGVLENVTPFDFYHEHVKPLFNMRDHLQVVHDPRNDYGKMYTVELLNNATDGTLPRYNNQPVSILKKIASESLKNDHAVWFGADVGKYFNKAHSLLALEAFDYKLVFDTTPKEMDKAERLRFGDTGMEHAMVFTGVHINKNESTMKWRVENSWGEDNMGKGYLTMSDQWFDEYVFMVVVNKKYVPADVLKAEESTPIQLPAWDPMGTLAN
ncbi:hypothetical protein SNEBB_006741 [Seison nebaliae]|nr:hypothetical protein SNEBB_006741 [Seison nebaliae]